MAKKKLTPEQEKEIKYLQANNEMLEKTKEEAKLRGTENSVKRIELAQQDVYEQMKKIDSTLAKKMAEPIKDEDKDFYRMLKDNNDNQTIFDAIEQAEDNKLEKKTRKNKKNIEKPINERIEEVSLAEDTDFNNIDAAAQYDVIPLPSNGECYSNKIKRVPVGYLTAYDENFITSPNLYKDGLIIDFLLKNKIMNNNIDTSKLCSGDVDAIVLFLRATSYGPDFPIVVNDPKSGQQIETTVDLSKIKYKEFNLKGDENGYFDFTLPVSKDVIKFKFLTRKEEKQLKLLNKIETENGKSSMILQNTSLLKDIIKSESKIDGKEKQEFIKALEKIDSWASENLNNESNIFTKLITNKLEMSIVSINDNTDKIFISKYVKNMNAKDSLMLRRYITENEPGVDFTVKVDRPESLGGGSFDTFLEWDDTIFLNI